MIAFEVCLNKRKKCTAGIRGRGVLSAILTWAEYKPADRRASRKELCLTIGGLASKAEEHLQWLNRDLQPGDEVTIRVINCSRVDAPKKRWLRHATPEKV